ncbi:MAG: hypothetical protein IPK34_12850 [Ramlibacter sp.]|nr:hypothetical protein [Ramlibacter sp.]
MASNVTLTDILSAGLSLISASGNNGTASTPGPAWGRPRPACKWGPR